MVNIFETMNYSLPSGMQALQNQQNYAPQMVKVDVSGVAPQVQSQGKQENGMRITSKDGEFKISIEITVPYGPG
jgi:hypothetical protein